MLSVETATTDLNLVVVNGTLAADPEVTTFDSGTRVMRYLVATRVEEPRRRVDVLPVTLWNPTDEQVEEGKKGDRIWLCGSVQRRFWEASDGRRSRVEIVAEQVNFPPVES